MLAGLALLLRILIPSGWMPAGDRIGLVPCFGVATATTHGPMAHHPAPHHDGHDTSDKGDRPCAFVGFACALAEPDGAIGALLPVLLSPAMIAAASSAASIGAGLAAPPPPPTGPPVTV
ncbi:hypothetical protein Q4F19_17945 [Sphingomonas sp. BIUV-7]|uniref:DUF2946 domain-containing protein n=2 Tax=Sphingomonas natans TaxID=3063330 RepID=A0ABT8YD59_9SPHN|nr:hypothetical protein [Sphingomonas sp. BIUV-7]